MGSTYGSTQRPTSRTGELSISTWPLQLGERLCRRYDGALCLRWSTLCFTLLCFTLEHSVFYAAAVEWHCGAAFVLWLNSPGIHLPILRARSLLQMARWKLFEK